MTADNYAELLFLLRNPNQVKQSLGLVMMNAADAIEALVKERDQLRAEVEAGRKLWKFVLETDEPWGEYQQEFVDMGLLKAVSIAPDAPEDDRCANCEGDCDVCYRPTGLLIDAALAAGEGEGEK